MPPESGEKKKRDAVPHPREEEARKHGKDSLQPSHEKIPEGAGNLRRRAEWFQKRSGQTP